MTRKPSKNTLFGRNDQPHTIIIARGESVRHFTIRPWAALAMGGVLATLALSYFSATAYLMFRDDLIHGSVASQARLRQAYEQRIASLRTQLDQATSRQKQEQKQIEAKMAELLERQKTLANRSKRLAPVVETIGESTLENGGARPLVPATDSLVNSDDEGFYGIDPIITGPTGPRQPSRSPRIGRGGTDKAELLDAVEDSLHAAETTQNQHILALSTKAYRRMDRIKQALASSGIAALPAASGLGGPFLPASPISDADARLAELEQATAQLNAAQSLLQGLPLADPVAESYVSSSFGKRRDPLLGIQAFHSGMDFAARTGSKVRAAAKGRVIAAEYSGGYGNMVEIDHGNGLATRYGHLSAILVEPGTEVAPGDIIGKVGSTGRSTGPHLHYEVRKHGSPVNPAPYLRAGRTLVAEL